MGNGGKSGWRLTGWWAQVAALALLGCGGESTGPRTQMVPFLLRLEGPAEVTGTVNGEGDRVCPFSITATASGNFPLPDAVWTQAKLTFFEFGTSTRIGSATWGQAQLWDFWGASSVEAGRPLSSQVREWSLRDLPGLDPGRLGSAFRLSVEFHYRFDPFSMTGSRVHTVDCG